MPRFVRIGEVVSRLQVDPEFIELLAREAVIELRRSSDNDPVLSDADVERVRVAWLLTRELDVNLPGVEVIVHMRDLILGMQGQFEAVLEALLEEAQRRGVR